MPVPETATQLQKVLRLVTYQSPFIPSLSSFTTPLCWLLQKGTEFIWNKSNQVAFDQVKSMVCKDTTLQYIDVHKPVTVQVNASQKGLGATLWMSTNLLKLNDSKTEFIALGTRQQLKNAEANDITIKIDSEDISIVPAVRNYGVCVWQSIEECCSHK